MASFYTILTSIGQAKVANAVALGQKVNLSTLAVGDANGVTPQPDASAKALVHECRRAPLNRIEIDKDNPNFIVCEQVLPPEVGGWEIREIGVFDDEGNLIAYGNYPPTYKPLMNEGTSRTQTVRMVMQVSNTAAGTLKVDPSIVLATRQYVNDKETALKNITEEIKKALGSLKDEAIVKKATALLDSIELYGKTGFIDWHFDGSEEDFTTRLIEEARGLIKLIGSLKVTGDLSVEGDLSLSKPLALSSGGTGATDAKGAREALELKAAAVMTSSDRDWKELAGSATEVVNSQQFVDFVKTFESVFATRSGPTNGYQKLPSGLIIQWGYETGVNTNNAGAMSFEHWISYPFPNNMLFAMGNMYSPGNTGWDNLKIWPKDRNCFYVKRATSLSNPFDYAYICIGY